MAPPGTIARRMILHFDHQSVLRWTEFAHSSMRDELNRRLSQPRIASLDEGQYQWRHGPQALAILLLSVRCWHLKPPADLCAQRFRIKGRVAEVLHEALRRATRAANEKRARWPIAFFGYGPTSAPLIEDVIKVGKIAEVSFAQLQIHILSPEDIRVLFGEEDISDDHKRLEAIALELKSRYFREERGTKGYFTVHPLQVHYRSTKPISRDSREETIQEIVLPEVRKSLGYRSLDEVFEKGNLDWGLYEDVKEAEEGRRDLAESHLDKIAGVLGVTKDDLRRKTNARQASLEQDEKLAQRLQKELGLEKAIVVKVGKTKDCRTLLSHATAAYLSSHPLFRCRRDKVIAVGGGQQMENWSYRMTPPMCGKLHFVEAVMPADPNLDPDNARNVVNNATRRCNRGQYKPEHEINERTFESARHADFCLLPVGAAASHSRGLGLWESLIGNEGLRDLCEKHDLLGDALYRLAGPRGTISPEHYGLLINGLDIENDLPRMSDTERILIAAGAAKGPIAAEIIESRRAVTHLICDQELANWLLVPRSLRRRLRDTLIRPMRGYRTEYHYARGARFEFGGLITEEKAYVDLEHPGPGTCRQCGSSETRFIKDEYREPVRTKTPVITRKERPVLAYAYFCENCEHGYIAMTTVEW